MMGVMTSETQRLPILSGSKKLLKGVITMEQRIYDGECFVTFNMLDINNDKSNITLAVTRQGKITVTDYSLLQDDSGLYFEYGPLFNKIYLDNFVEV